MSTRRTCPGRCPSRLGALVSLFGLLLWAGGLMAAQPDDEFDPGADAPVFAVLLLPDGQIFVAGGFGNIAGNLQPFLARLQPDGSFDPGFSASLNAPVHSLALDGEGGLVVGGRFTQVNGQSRSGLARFIEPAGAASLDAGFDPQVNGTVDALRVQSNGRILVGGRFTLVGGVTRMRLARLEQDGTVDPAFVVNADAVVRSIDVQADNRILVGGDFQQIAGQPRGRLARILASGVLDPSLTVDFNAPVYSVAASHDEGILVAGEFSLVAGQPMNGVARLTQEGVLVSTFDPSVPGIVRVVRELADGSIALAGSFSTVAGAAHPNFALLDRSGAPRPFAVPVVGAAVSALAQQQDGKLLLAGDFSSAAGENRQRLARVHPDGRLDTRWLAGSNGTIYGAATLQSGVNVPALPDGVLAVVGHFTEIGSPPAPRTNLALLTADGEPLPLNIAIDDRVDAVLQHGAGTLIIGGRFTSVGGSPRGGLARIDPVTGFISPTPGFPDTNGHVRALAMNNQGNSFFVAGEFTQVGGESRHRIAAVGFSAGVAAFAPMANAAVYAIAVDYPNNMNSNDSPLLVGGIFTTIDGVPRNRIARILGDGTLDPGFDPNANDSVRVISRQPDGRILVGGTFTQIGGVNRNRIARLQSTGAIDDGFNTGTGANGEVMTIALQANGKILVAGAFTEFNGQTCTRILRLNSNGSIDTCLTPGAEGGNVTMLAPQPDGKWLVGGTFASVQGVARTRLARLALPEAALQSLGYDQSRRVIWRLGGAAPEFSRLPRLSFFTGDLLIERRMVYIAGEWRHTTLQMPDDFTPAFLRARGESQVGYFGGSQGRIISEQAVFRGDGIYRYGQE